MSGGITSADGWTVAYIRPDGVTFDYSTGGGCTVAAEHFERVAVAFLAQRATPAGDLADALTIVQALPKLLGIEEDQPWASRAAFVQWLQVFGPRRDPPMTPDDVRRALAFIERRVRGDQAEPAPAPAELGRPSFWQPPEPDYCPYCEGRVIHPFKQETVYLPMDCPNCGRHRLEWDGYHVVCEKCGAHDWEHPSRTPAEELSQ